MMQLTTKGKFIVPLIRPYKYLQTLLIMGTLSPILATQPVKQVLSGSIVALTLIINSLTGAKTSYVAKDLYKVVWMHKHMLMLQIWLHKLKIMHSNYLIQVVCCISIFGPVRLIIMIPNVMEIVKHKLGQSFAKLGSARLGFHLSVRY